MVPPPGGGSPPGGRRRSRFSDGAVRVTAASGRAAAAGQQAGHRAPVKAGRPLFFHTCSWVSLFSSLDTKKPTMCAGHMVNFFTGFNGRGDGVWKKASAFLKPLQRLIWLSIAEKGGAVNLFP